MESTLDVEGMHCKSCAMVIEDALAENKAIRKVAVDVAAGKVKVDYDEKLTGLKDIALTIKAEGYKVRK